MSEEIANEQEQIEKEATQAELDRAKAAEIVGPLAKAGKSDEEIVVALIQEGGFAFKRAGRLLQTTLEELGVRMSSKERYTHVEASLVHNGFQPETWDDVTAAAEYFSEELDATTASQALAAIKKFAKANDITLPDSPKRGGGGGGRSGGGFRGKMFAWMVENPTATDEEFGEWLTSNEKDEKVVKRFIPLFQTARAIGEKLLERF